ncbi:MAG TPA: hypothetical protein VFC61_04515 [Blastocatellia bacterium]|nr:hypothetical protein [Blastocatellia bacterium]
MRFATLLIVILCAALSFGGSFTCKSDSNSDDFTQNPRTPVGNQ